MNSLLNKEKLLFDTLYSKVLDRSFAIAFQDYIGFLAQHGTDLLVHLGTDLIERQEKLDKLKTAQDQLLEKISKLRKDMGDIAEKLSIQDDGTIASSLSDLDSLIAGTTKILDGNRFDSMQSEVYDFVRRLLELEHYEEANKFLNEKLESSNQLSDRKITITKDIKAYLASEEVFNRQDINSLAGALNRLLDGYREMMYFSNNSIQFEATTDNFLDKLFENDRHKEYAKLMSGDLRTSHYFGRRRFHSDLERIHNSIVVNNEIDDSASAESNTIFRLENGDIYHYEQGKLTYPDKAKDQKYIQLFKNIIEYMPLDKNTLRITEFDKLLPEDKRAGNTYRQNLMTSSGAFSKFLSNNNVSNAHPKTKEPIIKVTDTFITFRNKL